MLTLSEIHARIEQELDALESLVTDVERDGRAAALAENAYKVAFAKSRLKNRAELESSKPTVGLIDDLATKETAELNLAHLIATNRMTSTREAVRATQARIDALRSLAASFRGAGG